MSNEYLNNKTFELIIHNFQNTKQSHSRLELLLTDILDKHNRMKFVGKATKLDNKYVEQKQLELRSASKAFEENKTKLAEAFYLLSQNIVRYAKFDLIDEDDAVQDGVMICFEKISRFDPSKGKAFNYLTTCVLNQLRQHYRTAKNYKELKKKYQEFIHIQLDIKL